MSLPRYPEYMDSGVTWFDKVPGHWELSVLKRCVLHVESGVSVNAVDEQASAGAIGVLKTSCVYSGKFDPNENKAVVPEDLERVACPVIGGTLIVSRMNTPALVGNAGFVADNAENLFLPDRLWQIHFSGALAKFAYYWTNSPSYRAQVEMACAGASSSMQNLSQDQFLRFCLPLPSKAEQAAIAAFLDRETAKIDALVAEQQKLVALLKEKRQALISHAVTKGLDPNVPMKDSGVEWLGEVPAQWERIQLGKVCRQISDGPHFSPSYVDEGVLFISARNVSVESWLLDDAKFISETDYQEFCKRITPEKGDVLYTKGGTTGIARVVDLDERFQVWVHIAVLKLHRSMVEPSFIAYALNSVPCFEQSQLYTHGATNQDLGLTRMSKIWFAMPPIHEQQEISVFLSVEVARLDELVAEARRAIALLQERRAALISAAVTGQIDVRGLVPSCEKV